MGTAVRRERGGGWIKVDRRKLKSSMEKNSGDGRKSPGSLEFGEEIIRREGIDPGSIGKAVFGSGVPAIDRPFLW